MPESELRKGFHGRLEVMRQRVVAMARTTTANLAGATTAFLELDPVAAQPIVATAAVAHEEYAWIERETFEMVALQAPVARDLRFLVATLRIAQEVERCADLVSSIARRTGRVEPAALTIAVRALIYEMGSEAGEMLTAATEAYDELDAERAGGVRDADDSIDEMHRRLLRELFAASGASTEAVVELGLVARFYERVADHAVVMAQRVRYAVTGSMWPADFDERGGGAASAS